MNGIDTGSLVKRLAAYRPRRVILFGSMIGDRSRPDSDIDLAIIKDTDRPFYRRAADVRKLLRSKIPLDVFVFTPSEYDLAKKTNPLVAEIDRTGKVIYDNPES